MIVTINDEKVDIRKTDATRHKYRDAITELLSTKLFDTLMDHSSGDVECPTGYFARYGRRIVVSDDRGFVWTETYGDEFGAEQVYNAMDRYYSAWSDEDEDMSEEERASVLAQCDRYLTYVVNVEGEANVALEFDVWRRMGEPNSVLG